MFLSDPQDKATTGTQKLETIIIGIITHIILQDVA